MTEQVIEQVGEQVGEQAGVQVIEQVIEWVELTSLLYIVCTVYNCTFNGSIVYNSQMYEHY